MKLTDLESDSAQRRLSAWGSIAQILGLAILLLQLFGTFAGAFFTQVPPDWALIIVLLGGGLIFTAIARKPSKLDKPYGLSVAIVGTMVSAVLGFVSGYVGMRGLAGNSLVAPAQTVCLAAATFLWGSASIWIKRRQPDVHGALHDRLIECFKALASNDRAMAESVGNAIAQICARQQALADAIEMVGKDQQNVRELLGKLRAEKPPRIEHEQFID